MSLTLTFTAETPKELRLQLVDAAAMLSQLHAGPTAPDVEAPTKISDEETQAPLQSSSGAAEAMEGKATGSRPRGRPKKGAAAPTETSPVSSAAATITNTLEEQEAAPAAPPAGAKVSKDDVTAAMKAVVGKLGLEPTRAILQKHGAAKLTDLKEEHYAAVLADCKAAVA